MWTHELWDKYSNCSLDDTTQLIYKEKADANITLRRQSVF